MIPKKGEIYQDWEQEYWLITNVHDKKVCFEVYGNLSDIKKRNFKNEDFVEEETFFDVLNNKEIRLLNSPKISWREKLEKYNC